eukprot:GHVS01068393.1.p1 GENE.GHVS01068393.1~~GHVS01068393.1.p1  ORF type:complete len:290 (-),score=81.88 GHVS01068393.1:229-1098(-)
MWAIWNKDLPGDALLTPPPSQLPAALPPPLLGQPPRLRKSALVHRDGETTGKDEGRRPNGGGGGGGARNREGRQEHSKQAKRWNSRSDSAQFKGGGGLQEDASFCSDGGGPSSVQKEQQKPLRRLHVKGEGLLHSLSSKSVVMPSLHSSTSLSSNSKLTTAVPSSFHHDPSILQQHASPPSPGGGGGCQMSTSSIQPPVVLGLLSGGAPSTFELIVVCNLLGIMLGLFGLAGGLYLCSICLSSSEGHIFNGRSCSLQQKVGGPVGVTIGLFAAVLSAGFIYSAVVTRKK